jgi:plastocyanin
MLRASWVVTLLVVLSGSALAGSINAVITVEAGTPAANAVVYAVPTTGSVPAPSKTAIMAQENQEFDPYVLPVQVGSTVEFPNKDSFRHHVYSFSPAKPFELKLFSGTERQVVTFDKEGSVALGCNIHDNMLAYIFVAPTPYFAKTGDDGKATITAPAGSYTVKVWHPNQRAGGPDTTQSITVTDSGVDYKAAIALKNDRKAKKPGAKDETEY